MTLARELRTVGTVTMILGGIVTVVGAGCGVLLWTTSSSDNWLIGAASVVLEWMAILGGIPVIAVGWSFRRGSQLAEAAAVLVGSALSLFGAHEWAVNASWLVAGAGTVRASSSTLFWAVVAGSIGAYLVGLGIAVGLERRDGARATGAVLATSAAIARVRRTFERPLVGALLLGAISSLGGSLWGALHPDPMLRAVVARRAQARNNPPPVDPEVVQAAWRACVASDQLEEYCGGVTSIAISPERPTFATAAVQSPGQLISLWDREAGRRVWKTYVSAGEDPYQSMGISSDGHYLYFATRTAGMLLAMADGKVVRAIERCHDPAHPPAPAIGLSVYGVTFSPDARQLAVGGGGICLVDLATGAVARRLATGSLECDGEQLVFAANGAAIHAICYGHMRTWDVRSGKQVAELPFGTRNDPRHVEPSPGTYSAILSVSSDGAKMLTLDREDGESLWRWDLGTLTGERVIPRCPLGAVLGPRLVRADGLQLLLGGSGLQVMDLQTGRQTKVLLENRTITAIAEAKGGAYVLAGVHISIPDRRPSILALTASEFD
jgi:hypothetical protein